MKVFKAITFAVVAFLLLGCKPAESVSKEDVSDLIKRKVVSKGFIFKPRTAIPMSGRTITLDDSFSLRVSKDTIESYLPFFGRAYSAPFSSSSGGIKFVSTNFDYIVSDAKKSMWNVNIETKDTPTKCKMFLDIGDSGYATLTVQEVNRQSISFYGKIE